MADVVHQLQELTALTILVDWAALGEAQFTPSSTVACSAIDRPWSESLDGVLKCNVYCVPGEGRFQTFNEIYGRYFPDTSPARIFMHVPSWPGPFDIEIDCVAAI